MTEEEREREREREKAPFFFSFTLQQATALKWGYSLIGASAAKVAAASVVVVVVVVMKKEQTIVFVDTQTDREKAWAQDRFRTHKDIQTLNQLEHLIVLSDFSVPGCLCVCTLLLAYLILIIYYHKKSRTSSFSSE